jgi:hypothetical protein
MAINSNCLSSILTVQVHLSSPAKRQHLHFVFVQDSRLKNNHWIPEQQREVCSSWPSLTCVHQQCHQEHAPMDQTNERVFLPCSDLPKIPAIICTCKSMDTQTRMSLGESVLYQHWWKHVYRSLTLGARAATAAIATFQICGEVPKCALTLGTPRTSCVLVTSGRLLPQPKSQICPHNT